MKNSADVYLEFVKIVFCTEPVKKDNSGGNVYPMKELVRELVEFWMLNPVQKHEYSVAKRSIYLKSNKASGTRKKNKSMTNKLLSPYTGENMDTDAGRRVFYEMMCDQVGDWFLIIKNPDTVFYYFYTQTLYGKCELSVCDEGVWVCKNRFFFIPLWYIALFPRAMDIYQYWIKQESSLFKERTYDFYSIRLSGYIHDDKHMHLPVMLLFYFMRISVVYGRSTHYLVDHILEAGFFV